MNFPKCFFVFLKHTVLVCFFLISSVNVLADNFNTFGGRTDWLSQVVAIPDDESVGPSYIISSVSPDLSNGQNNLSQKKFINNLGTIDLPASVEIGAVIVANSVGVENRAVGEFSCSRYESANINFVAQQFASYASNVKCIWIDPSSIRSPAAQDQNKKGIKFHKPDLAIGFVGAIRSGFLTGMTLYYSEVASISSLSFISVVASSMIGCAILGAYWEDFERFYQGKLTTYDNPKIVDIDSVDTQKLKGPNSLKLTLVFEYIKYSVKKGAVLLFYDSIRKFLSNPSEFLTHDGVLSLLKRRAFGLISDPAAFVANQSMYANYLSPFALKWIREFNFWVGGTLSMAVLFAVEEITLLNQSFTPDFLLFSLIGVNSLGQFVNYFFKDRKFAKMIKSVENKLGSNLTGDEKQALVKLVSVTGISSDQIIIDDLKSYALGMEKINLGDGHKWIGESMIEKLEIKYRQKRAVEKKSVLQLVEDFFFGRTFKCSSALFHF